ncbi:MAG TPA: DnaJ C-terminal domain-containing protein [Myxococcota bacterium]|nr:DnaJ C-terminal domain-containing protein [Myxococcota bacterium]HRY93899.1 DnaJ C-terminal domain-containing protein [Myxococcota bacterium]
MRTYYDILGVKREASDKELKTAFRRLARKHHPDVNPGDKGAEERFKEVSEAYDVLSDKAKRQVYDQVGHEAWKAGLKSAPPPGAGRRGGAPFDGFPGFEGIRFEGAEGEGAFGDLPLEDLLGGIFGGGPGGRRRSAGPRRGQDHLSRLAISLTDAVHGAERRLTLTGEDGRSENLSVRIPAGVREGQKIRLAGKGSPGRAGGPPGDLLLEVAYEPDARFQREGELLVTEVPLPFGVAALGGNLRVETLDGAVDLSVPAGTQGGQRFRLRGKGLPRSGGGRGDLLVRVNVNVPRRLDDQGRSLVEQLARYE